ncbi:MAG: SprT-like domain-containing protein [Bryobacter sp.]
MARQGTDWQGSLQSSLFFESVEEIYARVFRTLRPQLGLPEIEVRFRRFTSASSRVRFRQGKLSVGISDLLEKAPAPVQEALAFILLSKLFRQNVPARAMNQYRQYLRRPDMQATIDATRRERGTKRFSGPAGSYYNLETLFDEVNSKYFANSLPRPTLSWSTTASRTILGQYDSAHHTIVLSRVLDQPGVPAFVVEYVMFHEMLHIKHPTETCAGPTAKRRVHTRAFREEEKTFPRFAEIKEALRRLP